MREDDQVALTFAIRRVKLQGSRLWEIHFRYQNAKI